MYEDQETDAVELAAAGREWVRRQCQSYEGITDLLAMIEDALDRNTALRANEEYSTVRRMVKEAYIAGRIAETEWED